MMLSKVAPLCCAYHYRRYHTLRFRAAEERRWRSTNRERSRQSARTPFIECEIEARSDFFEAVSEVEEWMSKTSEGAMHAFEHAIDLKEIDHLFDVGGGAGTMAIQLVRKYANLRVTVFNLPKSAFLARNNIGKAGVTDRVRVHEGDFLKVESFPDSFDLVLFSRVLTDWSPETCKKFRNLDPQ